MTDEATREGAESAVAAPAAPVSDTDRLKAILGMGQPAEAEPAEPVEAPVEGKAETEEAPPEAEAAEAEDTGAETEATAEQETHDLARIAKSFGVSASDLVVNEDGSLAFRTKIDGQEGRATLDALRKSFQLDGAHTRRLMELAEEKKAFEKARTERETALAEREKQVDEHLAVARADYFRDFDAVDWNFLRANDPDEFNRQYISFQQRAGVLNQALEARAKAHQEAAQKQEAQIQERIAKEYTELLNHIPSWSDDKVRSKEQAAIAEFLKGTYGASDADVEAVGKTSAMAVRIVRDAFLYHESQKAAQKAKAEALTKIQNAPKMAKPGTPAGNVNPKRELEAARVAFRKSGGRLDRGAEVLRKLGVVGGKR